MRTSLVDVLAISAENLSPSVRESIQTIHESVELEVQLIGDLLDLTKIARGKVQLHLQDSSAHELLGRTLQIVSHDIASKKLHISTEAQATGDRIMVDPARMQQVFWNIIKNAIKFTPENGSLMIRTSNYEIEEEMYEEVETETTNNTSDPRSDSSFDHTSSACKLGKTVMLRIEVQDTGIGIETDIIPYLFHAFEQGDASVTLRFGGLGLGLAISRSLIEMHHGVISAHSEGKGKGATFVITLPTTHKTIPSTHSSDISAILGPAPAQPARRHNVRKDLGLETGEKGAVLASESFICQPSTTAIRRAAMSPSFSLGSLLKVRQEGQKPSTPSVSRRATSSPASPHKEALPALSSSRAKRISFNPPTPSARPTSSPPQHDDTPTPPAFCARSRSTPTLPSATVSSSSVSPLRPAAPIRPLKVLLVEDNKSTLLIMSRLLQQRLGYQVLVASSVKDAISVAAQEQGKFDLVISDIGLPDGTGLQLMKVLRENYGLKGIALSGYGMEEDIKRSKDAGFEVHLTKPINFSSLTAVIQRVLPPNSTPPSPATTSTSARYPPTESSPGLPASSSSFP